jgi:hypothetical protein
MVEHAFTHELKPMRDQEQLENQPVFQLFLEPNLTKYALSRCRHQLAKGAKCELNSKGDGWFKVSSKSEEAEFKINLKEGKLLCSCGYSTLAGLPCSHELFVCKDFNELACRSRWFKKYEAAMMEKFYDKNEENPGIMTEHLNKDVIAGKKLVKERKNATRTRHFKEDSPCLLKILKSPE